MYLIIAAVVMASVGSTPCRATPEFEGKVVRILDGRTIVVHFDQEVHRPARRITVRLYGITIPTTPKRNAIRAARFLKALALGKKVKATVLYRDVSPVHCRVWVGDRELNCEILKAGLAIVERQPATSYPELTKAEKEARVAKREIWR